MNNLSGQKMDTVSDAPIPCWESFDGFWYQAEVKHFASVDEWGDACGSHTQMVWTKFAVHRETPKGVWLISTPWGNTDPDSRRDVSVAHCIGGVTFVLGNSKRQLACPTKAAALRDCRARKERHIAGCRARLQRAEDDLFHIKMAMARVNIS